MYRFLTLGRLDLTDESGDEVRRLLRQPKSVALLAFLAASAPRGHQRRDTLLGLLWPESEASRARGALNQTVYRIRKVLGPDVLESRGRSDLVLSPDAFWCDAEAFSRCLEEGRREEALDLYRGEFLPGFHLADAAEFQRWLDGRRRTLKRSAVEAARTLAREADERGDLAAAVEWSRRETRSDPYGEAALRRLLERLGRLGDRPGAVEAFEAFAERLEEDLEVPPSPETVELIAAIRRAPAARRDPQSMPRAQTAAERAAEPAPAGQAHPGETSAETTPARATPGELAPAGPGATGRTGARVVSADGGEPGGSWGRRVAAIAVIMLLGAGAALGMALGSDGSRTPTPRVVAVAPLDWTGDGEIERVAGVIPSLLSTNLARTDGLHVVAPERTRVFTTPVDADAAGDTDRYIGLRMLDVDQVIVGTLHAAGDGMLTLSLRSRPPDGSRITGSVVVRGRDPYELVDRATAGLFRELEVDAPPLRVRDVTTSSVVALQFYREGLEAYYDGRFDVARRYLGQAVEEDSTFAMATLYLARSILDDNWRRYELLDRATELAQGISDRERLVVETAWATDMHHPSLEAKAETLSIRYPTEPEGFLRTGWLRTRQARYPEAVRALGQAVELDPPAPPGVTVGRCVACDAYYAMIHPYRAMDSLPAAERAIRAWIRREPDASQAWQKLSTTLARMGRFDEARWADRNVADRDPTDLRLQPAWLLLRDSRWNEAVEILEERIRNGNRATRHGALYWLAAARRAQGRPGEAAILARRFAALSDSITGRPVPGRRLVVGDALLEAGRPEAAAVVYDSIVAAPRRGLTPAREARAATWAMAHAAEAYAAMGDTARLAALADTMEALGRQGTRRREQVIHHHVRGLMHRLDGDHAAALASFRRAYYSPSEGYHRNHLALAKALVEAGRGEEAVDILESTLRGPMQVSTPLVRVRLGDAYRAVGRNDLALREYRRVLRSWDDPEPSYEARRQAVVDRVQAIKGP